MCAFSQQDTEEDEKYLKSLANEASEKITPLYLPTQHTSESTSSGGEDSSDEESDDEDGDKKMAAKEEGETKEEEEAEFDWDAKMEEVRLDLGSPVIYITVSDI